MTTPYQNGRHARIVFLSPAHIRDHWLPAAPWGRRGYAKEDVRRLLSVVAEQVESMQADINALRVTLHHRELEIEQRRYGVSLPARGYERADDEMLLRWQVDTQRYSDDITAMAQRQAAEIVGEAKTQADQVRAEMVVDLNAAAELADLRLTVSIMRQCLYNVRRYIETTDETIRGGYRGNPSGDTESTAVQSVTLANSRPRGEE